MAQSLEQILNTIIPWGIFIGFAGFIYWKFKKPIDIMFKGLGSLLSNAWDSISTGGGKPSTEVIYK